MNAAENWQDDDSSEHRAESARLAKLADFCGVLTKKRKEAIDGRKQSGIEEIWHEDEEFYDGIDDANRGEITVKPTSSNGRLTSRRPASSTRSTVFVNITQPYVDMASARVADMALPTDDRPFSAKPTPVPDIEAMIGDQSVMPNGNTVGAASEQFLTAIKDKADKAENKIWDWLCESRWHGEVRKVIEQAARIGCGCLKGPYPERKRKRKVEKDEFNNVRMTIIDEIKPVSRMIDVRNLYPDPSCGENIHNGAYIFERDIISGKQLKDLRGGGYIDSEIDAVLKEGPNKIYQDSGINDRIKGADTENYEIWYYHGEAKAAELESAHCGCDDMESMSVVVVMVNDRIIKASRSILDSGEFPYDVMVWQYRAGTWAGKGVARQIRTSQNMVNAASRNLLDNAGISAGPQIVIKQGIISPADGDWTITPMKIWYADADADINDINHSVTSILIPSMQAELENIIKLALDFAERSTSMPLMLQGQQGVGMETATGRQLLQNNSNTVLRRIAKIYDDDLIEPHIVRYYEYLMLHGDDDSMKGDFSIVALGSSSLYERDSQNQMIMQMVPMSANPAFGLDPSKLMVEILKMNKISPERVRFTDEEIKQQQEQEQQNPPTDPRIEGQKQVAQLRIQGEMQKAQLVQQSDMAELQLKEKIETSSLVLKHKMMEEQHAHDLQIKEMEMQIKMMELAQAQQISLDSIKAALASDTMKLKTQKELSLLGHQMSQVATPPTEPAGRAPDGEAYQR